MIPDAVENALGLNVELEDGGRKVVTDARERSVADEIFLTLEDAGEEKTGIGETMSAQMFTDKLRTGAAREIPPDPRDVHRDRSEYAQKQDEARDAQLTTDPRQYANNPDEYDFPGVDTGPQFRRNNDVDPETFVEDVFSQL